MKVVVENLTKKYGDITAVSDVSFKVGEGEIFGLLGPNGAGKTTTIEIIEGLRSFDSGKVFVDDIDISEQNLKQKIGILLQNFAFEDKLTVKEILKLFASFYKSSIPVNDIIELVALVDKRNDWVKNLSGGQKQRMALGVSLINNPSILFLDEPTVGLDPQARRNLWDVIIGAKKLGKTIFLTTHYMDEAEKLCDRIAIMDHGQLIALDTPRKLIMKLSGENIIEFTKHPEIEKWLISEGISYKLIDQTGKQRCILASDNVYGLYKKLIDISEEKKIILDDLMIRAHTLEDVFIELTGREIRE